MKKLIATAAMAVAFTSTANAAQYYIPWGLTDADHTKWWEIVDRQLGDDATPTTYSRNVGGTIYEVTLPVFQTGDTFSIQNWDAWFFDPTSDTTPGNTTTTPHGYDYWGGSAEGTHVIINDKMHEMDGEYTFKWAGDKSHWADINAGFDANIFEAGDMIVYRSNYGAHKVGHWRTFYEVNAEGDGMDIHGQGFSVTEKVNDFTADQEWFSNGGTGTKQMTEIDAGSSSTLDLYASDDDIADIVAAHDEGWTGVGVTVQMKNPNSSSVRTRINLLAGAVIPNGTLSKVTNVSDYKGRVYLDSKIDDMYTVDYIPLSNFSSKASANTIEASKAAILWSKFDTMSASQLGRLISFKMNDDGQSFDLGEALSPVGLLQ